MITAEEKAELAELATEINAAHDQAESHTDQAVGMAGVAIRLRIKEGEKLARAKKLAGHGSWLPWLEANCPKLTERSAQNYMRLAAKAKHVADLTDASSVTEAYVLCGLLPEREGQDNQKPDKGVNYLVHITRLERVLTEADAAKWQPQDKAQLRARLKPLVDLYERLAV